MKIIMRKKKERRNRRYRVDRSKSKLKEAMFYYIKDNFKYYIYFFSIFVLGVIIGTFFVNNLSDSGKEEIISYLNSSIFAFKESGINSLELLKYSIRNNFLIGIVLWFLGSTIIGIIIAILFIGFMGFCLGYTISSVTLFFGIPKGILFSLITMLMQNLLFIPSIITISVSGMKFCKQILTNFKRNNIKEELLKHTVISTIFTTILIISSFVHVFISKNLLIFLIKYF